MYREPSEAMHERTNQQRAGRRAGGVLPSKRRPLAHAHRQRCKGVRTFLSVNVGGSVCVRCGRGRASEQAFERTNERTNEQTIAPQRNATQRNATTTFHLNVAAAGVPALSLPPFVPSFVLNLNESQTVGCTFNERTTATFTFRCRSSALCALRTFRVTLPCLPSHAHTHPSHAH